MKFINTTQISPKKLYNGFTLAEVLLTLTIIGVVAALTVPTLINNIQQAQCNTGAQAAYSMLSQAIGVIQQSGGGLHLGIPPAGPSDALRNDFCSVLTCVKTSESPSTIGSISYLNYKGSTLQSLAQYYGSTAYGGPVPGAALNNGMYLIQFIDAGSCTYNGINACGGIFVDINGEQGPNMFGDDVILFYIVINNGVYSLLPAGSPQDISPYDTCTANLAFGWGCTYQRVFSPNNLP